MKLNDDDSVVKLYTSFLCQNCIHTMHEMPDPVADKMEDEEMRKKRKEKKKSDEAVQELGIMAIAAAVKGKMLDLNKLKQLAKEHLSREMIKLNARIEKYDNRHK